MPKSKPAYPEQFRREALVLVRGGRSVPGCGAELGGVVEQHLLGPVSYTHLTLPTN